MIKYITFSNIFILALLFCANQSAFAFTSVSVDKFEQTLWNETILLLDVRTPQEYAQGHIPGASLANMQDIAFVDNVSTIIAGKDNASNTIAIYCRSGRRSKQAATTLEKAGYTIIELDGGFIAWEKAKKPVAKGSYATLQRFEAHNFAINQHVNLQYRQTATGTAIPKTLIVYLHNSSARGIDNELQVRRRLVQQLMNYLDSTQYSAWVVLPQCRKDRYWNERRPVLGCKMSEGLYRFIQDFKQNHAIERIYIIGESFGGTGVWRLLTDHPMLCNGGMVIASHPAQNTKAKRVSKTPLCIVASENDPYSTVEKIQPMVDELQKLGAPLRYELLAKADYQQFLAEALSPANLDWLLQQ